MKKLILVLYAILIFSGSGMGQKPVDIYKKPLKEVLIDIEKRYKVKLQYSESLVKGVDVLYPTWRYRTEIEPTLQNILMPLDLVFEKTGNNTYRRIQE